MARRLSLEAQAALLRLRFPHAYCKTERGGLRWRGEIRPTDMSATYVVRIHYRRGDPVRCWVVHPALVSRDGEPLPHVYPDGSLCLFLPSQGEWDSSRPIADTIVPWASEWLFFYELWLPTGEWLGGGAHADSP